MSIESILKKIADEQAEKARSKGVALTLWGIEFVITSPNRGQLVQAARLARLEAAEDMQGLDDLRVPLTPAEVEQWEDRWKEEQVTFSEALHVSFPETKWEAQFANYAKNAFGFYFLLAHVNTPDGINMVTDGGRDAYKRFFFGPDAAEVMTAISEKRELLEGESEKNPLGGGGTSAVLPSPLVESAPGGDLPNG